MSKGSAGIPALHLTTLNKLIDMTPPRLMSTFLTSSRLSSILLTRSNGKSSTVLAA